MGKYVCTILQSAVGSVLMFTPPPPVLDYGGGKGG